MIFGITMIGLLLFKSNENSTGTRRLLAALVAKQACSSYSGSLFNHFLTTIMNTGKHCNNGEVTLGKKAERPGKDAVREQTMDTQTSDARVWILLMKNETKILKRLFDSIRDTIENGVQNGVPV